jgi:hypothetical protein
MWVFWDLLAWEVAERTYNEDRIRQCLMEEVLVLEQLFWALALQRETLIPAYS